MCRFTLWAFAVLCAASTTQTWGGVSYEGWSLIVAGERVVRVDLHSGESETMFDNGVFIRGVAIDVDQGVLFAGGDRVYRHSLATAPNVATNFTNPIGNFGTGHLAFAPNGDLLVAGDTVREVLRFNSTTGQQLGSLRMTGCCNIVGLHVEGNLVYAPEVFQGRILRWDLSANPVQGSVAVTSSQIDYGLGVTIGHNGNIFISSHDNQRIQQFNAATGAFVSTFIDLAAIGYGASQDVTYVPQLGQYFVTSSGRVLQFDPTGELIATHHSALMGGTVQVIAVQGLSPIPSPIRLLESGATWKYHDQGVNLGTAWRAAAYDDSAWAAGPAQLGYGDGDEETIVSFGPNANSKYPTTYFRHTLDIADPVLYDELDLVLVYDDAAAIYLNGLEVGRTANLPANAAYGQFATSTSSDNDNQIFTISADALVAGANVLAVEVHQATADSSDLSFDLQIIARLRGDFDGDNDVDADDIDTLLANMNSGNPRYDLNRSGGLSNEHDVAFLVRRLLNTELGDANLDGRVNIRDMSILAANYGDVGGWADGNFNAGGEITINDLTTLARHFGFVRADAAVEIGAAAIPAPAASMLAMCGMACLRSRRPR